MIGIIIKQIIGFIRSSVVERLTKAEETAVVLFNLMHAGIAGYGDGDWVLGLLLPGSS